MRTYFLTSVIENLKNIRIKSLLACILLILGLSEITAQNTIQLESKIVKVTVYADKAFVNREAVADLQPGRHTVVFKKLPAAIDENSIRVSGFSEGGVFIENIRIEEVNENAEEESVNLMRVGIDQMKTVLKEVNDRIAICNTKKDFIEAQKKQAGFFISEKIRANIFLQNEFNSVLTYMDSATNKLQTEMRTLTLRKKTAEIRIEMLRRDMMQGGQKRAKISRNIYADIEVKSAGKVFIRPSYFTGNTIWYPQYDVRIATDTRTAELKMKSFVSQSTGENWDNVALTLSLKNSYEDLQTPTMDDWVIDLQSQYQNSRVRMWGNTGTSQKDLRASYALTGLFTIPSDHNEHMIIIDTVRLPVSFSYVTVPKIAPYVYRTGGLVNVSQLHWAEGDINLFVDNEFISRTIMPVTFTGDTLQLPMGAENRIRVERVLVSRFRDNSGLFGNSRKISYEYEIRLTNNRKTSEKVYLSDQVPVIKDASISVNLLQPVIERKDIRTDGKLAWTLNLSPGERIVIPLKYQITFPANISVYGLE